MPASQAVAGIAVTVEVSVMHRKNTEIEQTSGVIHKEYRPVKNNYQQVKNMKKVVDFLVSLR